MENVAFAVEFLARVLVKPSKRFSVETVVVDEVVRVPRLVVRLVAELTLVLLDLLVVVVGVADLVDIAHVVATVAAMVGGAPCGAMGAIIVVVWFLMTALMQHDRKVPNSVGQQCCPRPRPAQAECSSHSDGLMADTGSSCERGSPQTRWRYSPATTVLANFVWFFHDCVVGGYCICFFEGSSM